MPQRDGTLEAKASAAVARSPSRIAALALLALILAGCGMLPRVTPDAATRSLTITAASTANDGFAVAVDIVAVESDALVATVMAMSANDWFAGRDQFAADNIGRATLWSYELVPGQTIEPIQFSRSERWDARAIVVFAHYLGPGDHRLRVDTLESPQVVLGPRTLSLAQPGT